MGLLNDYHGPWREIIQLIDEVGVDMQRLGLPGGTHKCNLSVHHGAGDDVVSAAQALQSIRLVKKRLLHAIEGRLEICDLDAANELQILLDRMRDALEDLKLEIV